MHRPLVDFHCHLDLYRDYETIFSKCRQTEVEVLAVTTTPRAWAKNKELAAGAANIRVGLGLHPQLIAEGVDELALFRELLPKVRYVGEVGLDASPKFYRSFQSQKHTFESVLRACGEEGGKILSVHSVRCANEVIKMIGAFLPQAKGTAVLHWFTGSASEAKRATQLGCYFSINFEMLRDDKRQNLVTSLPRERLLTETDGPFTMTDGRPSAPDDICLTMNKLAILLKIDVEEAKSLILQNLRQLERSNL